jgi:hypothetical protein
LLPYVEEDGIAAISFEELGAEEAEALLSALTTEGHLLAVAALASLFLAPTDEGLKALRGRLSDYFRQTEVHRAMELVTTFHRLEPQLRALALKGLVKEPPQLESFELTASVAGCVPFTKAKLSALFQSWQGRDPGGALRAMVDVAAIAGGRKEVEAYFSDGLRQENMTLGDLRYALADGRSAAYPSDAQKEVFRAVEALRVADVITREAAVFAVKEAALGSGFGMVGADELVCTALASLYQQDLVTVAPLNEVEAAVGKVTGEAFVDPRPISQRLGIHPMLDVNELKRSEPALASKLETVKARVELQQLVGDGESLAQVALRQLLETEPNIEPALQQALLEHLESWAYGG